MKKNYAMRIAALVLMCTIITACFAGTTFARYTSTGSGTGDLVAASWSIKAGGTELTSAGATYQPFTTADKLYPGYEETQSIVIENASEVPAEITVDVTKAAGSYEGIEIAYGTAENATAVEGNPHTYLVDAGKTLTLPVSVKWAYDYDDAKDTAAAGKTVATLDVKVTAVQHNPENGATYFTYS